MIAPGVELREIQVFLALCEELHFGRTAERLLVTPSRISQIIRDLERKLGGQLVLRTSRSVALTPLGERLHARVNGPYAEITGIIDQTRAEGRSLTGVLRVALFSGPAAGPHLKTIIDAFEARFPDCSVEISEVPLGDAFGPLLRGEIPLMASWIPHGRRDLVTGPTLNREPRVLLVPPDHPLADAAHVSVEELASCRVPHFVGMPRELHETWIPSRTPSGRPIRTVRVDGAQSDFSRLGMQIARGMFVHLTVPSAVPLFAASNELVALRVIDLPPWRSALIWRRRAVDAKGRAFIRITEQVVKSRSRSGTDAARKS